MLFRSIKNTTITLTAISICFVCAAVLFFTIQEHENLYLDFVKKDIDGLSENMTNDLVPLLASKPDIFDLTTMLLRLDRYESVKYAVIYDKNWAELQVYVGAVFAKNNLISQFRLKGFPVHTLGMNVLDGELVATKLIGDPRLPIGYLQIVYDVASPLQLSKFNLLKRVLPLTLVVLFAVVIGLFLLQGRLFSPLSRLSQLAQNIRRTKDYSLRIDVSGKQEVAELSQDINNMMETISSETQKNNKYTKQLKEQQSAMERLANFDSLTGLPNRQFFMETLRVELAKASRLNTDLVLLYIDLDGFKGVNDSFGHEVGDKLLVAVGQRFKKLLREGDIISRLGGDEFLVLLHNSPCDAMLFEIAERLVTGLSAPFYVDSWEVQVGASVGIAQASDANFSLKEFVINADIAMYNSKLAGRNTHTVFVPEMLEDRKRRLLIANSIVSALKDDEFFAVYQAKVTPDGVVVGYEALIRWQHETLGMVSPAEFIPLAEQSGKISFITQWMLERVSQDLPDINKLNAEEVVVSINLSAHDINNPSLMKSIKSLFTQYQVEPSKIEFEITESAYLENFETANDFLKEIKFLGCTIALDDFGTGYSSLAYLTKINVDTLKIDKQFVENIGLSEQGTLITKTIMEMAKQLNFKICAEGVETRTQLDFLKKNGCHQIQGYLFAKPQTLHTLMNNPSVV